jgi:acyl-[acyl-carrier-protein]-phospholipid O-acyltransferase/long-chain-fatty-acid--[acyl-carrier-protein] ligase
VALDAVEDVARAASGPDYDHAAILDQSPEFGDRIVLFTTDPALERAHLVRAAQEKKRSLLGLPKPSDIHYLEEIPKLPTGKPDYQKLKKAGSSFEDLLPPALPPPHEIDMRRYFP